MSDIDWLMPAYYPDFRCKCAACRHTCCHGWQIPVSRKEYYRLISMQCSSELRRKIDHGFITPEKVTEERFRIISFNYLGDCPIQKDGLCSLQNDKGESLLPTVCRLYPRSLKQVNGVAIACCSSSCEHVVEMLMHMDALQLIHQPMAVKPELTYSVDETYTEKLKRYNHILSDNSESLPNRLMIICLDVNTGDFEKDYNASINPLSEALMLLERLADETTYLYDITQNLLKRYQDNFFQFELDRIVFEKNCPNWQRIFENILNNSLMYENFPFVDVRFNQTDAYRGICASYGLLRLVCIGHCAEQYSEEQLADAIAALFHLIDHTAFYYNVNVLLNSAAILLKI